MIGFVEIASVSVQLRRSGSKEGLDEPFESLARSEFRETRAGRPLERSARARHARSCVGSSRRAERPATAAAALGSHEMLDGLISALIRQPMHVTHVMPDGCS